MKKIMIKLLELFSINVIGALAGSLIIHYVFSTSKEATIAIYFLLMAILFLFDVFQKEKKNG